jgi:hypothetical protein
MLFSECPVTALHAAGWCGRNCKTKNFVYADGRVWAIDFAFANRIRGHPAPSGRAAERQDLYALGIAFTACSPPSTMKRP